MSEVEKDQAAYLRTLVRMDLRQHYKAIERMKSKFGAGYDGTEHDAKTEFIKEVYRTLGGDPARITARGGRS